MRKNLFFLAADKFAKWTRTDTALVIITRVRNHLCPTRRVVTSSPGTMSEENDLLADRSPPGTEQRPRKWVRREAPQIPQNTSPKHVYVRLKNTANGMRADVRP